VYQYVGATPEDVEKDPEAREQKKRWRAIEWRIEFLSPTRLAALLPLLICLIWLLVIVILLFQKL
jgi:hypothetical protein